MSLFIACPRVDESNKKEISFILFDDSGSSVAKGSKTFFKPILKRMDLHVSPLSWEIHVCRSSYFSDYVEEEDWRDVWRIVWVVTLKTDKNIDSPPLLEDIFVEVDSVDKTATYANRVTDDSLTDCLIISDFTAIEDVNKAVKEIKKNKFMHNSVEHSMSINIVTVINDILQLHIKLERVEPAFYSEGAELANDIQLICKKQGGTLHFQDKFP